MWVHRPFTLVFTWNKNNIILRPKFRKRNKRSPLDPENEISTPGTNSNIYGTCKVFRRRSTPPPTPSPSSPVPEHIKNPGLDRPNMIFYKKQRIDAWKDSPAGQFRQVRLPGFKNVPVEHGRSLYSPSDVFGNPAAKKACFTRHSVDSSER